MKQKIIFCILLQIFSSICFSQKEESDVKLLSISLGLSNESLKDRVFSGLRFQGVVYDVGIGFEKASSNSFWSSNISAKYGSIKYNDFFKSTFINFNLNLKYLVKLKSSSLKSLYLGPSLSSRMNILDYDGYENGSWFTGHSLDLSMKKNFEVGNLNFETELLLPFLGLLSRPPYAGRDEYLFSNTDNIAKIIFTRNQFYFLHKFINPQLSVSYKLNTGKINLATILKYEYLFLDSLLSYQRNSLCIGFKIGFNLKKYSKK